MSLPDTIVLRGIDVQGVLLKYLSKGFINNSHPVVCLKGTSIVHLSGLSDSELSFIYKDITGKTLRIRITGNIEDQQCCLWCRKELDSSDVLGIPIKLDIDNEIKYFSVLGRICQLNCGLAFVQFMKLLRGVNEVTYKESESLLHLMHKELGYVTELKPAMGFWHLKVFGGSYSYEEFSKEHSVPAETVNLRFFRMLHFQEK